MSGRQPGAVQQPEGAGDTQARHLGDDDASWLGWRTRVVEPEVVGVDMPPPLGGEVQDPDPHRPAFERPEVPRHPLHSLVVLAGCEIDPSLADVDLIDYLDQF